MPPFQQGRACSLILRTGFLVLPFINIQMTASVFRSCFCFSALWRIDPNMYMLYTENKHHNTKPIRSHFMRHSKWFLFPFGEHNYTLQFGAWTSVSDEDVHALFQTIRRWNDLWKRKPRSFICSCSLQDCSWLPYQDLLLRRNRRFSWSWCCRSINSKPENPSNARHCWPIQEKKK